MHSDYVTVLKIEIQIKSKQIIRLYQIVFDNYANYKCTKASFHRCLYILSLDQNGNGVKMMEIAVIFTGLDQCSCIRCMLIQHI